MNDHLEVQGVEVVLAAIDGPVRVDALRSTGLWPGETLEAEIERLLRSGEVEVDPGACPRALRWRELATRADVLARGGPGALVPLLAHAPFPALLLDSARAAERAWDHARARALHVAIACAPDPELFPGGAATWLGAVVEAALSFRTTWGVPLAKLDAATELARSLGNTGAAATLLTARGLQSVWNDPTHSHSFHERAVEAAEAAGDPALIQQCRTHLALSLIIGGRICEGIAAAERALGDLPEDLLEGPMATLAGDGGPAPGWPIAIIAWAHATTGDHPRALEMLHRMAAKGRELGSRELQAQAWLFLALVYAVAGDPGAALPHAEAAHAHWSETGKESAYAWLAAVGLAVVRGAQGHLGAARDVLVAALPRWRDAERLSLDTSLAYHLLEDLERAGFEPLPGYDLEGEIARRLDADNAQLAGIAHRLQARRLVAVGGAEPQREAARHLKLAGQLLRRSGGLRELYLALTDAADLADWMSRADEAQRLRREAVDVARQIPAARLGGSTGALRLAPALLDLGRLGGLSPQREGLWGEIAARLCRDFGAERCAIVQATPAGPMLLAARGASAWQAQLLARLSDPPQVPTFEPALGEREPSAEGQLVLVPIADEVLGHRGFVALENRYSAPVVGPGDEALVAALGRQVGILLANVGLWRELLETRQRLEQENRYHREDEPHAAAGSPIVAVSSPAMRRLLDLVARVAPATTPVLITGETGVGKELVARELHRGSTRRNNPLITVHIASLAPGLAAAALFGHERGAFTGATELRKGRFELADGGTIFLDEIGELSLEDQVRLLRVLQEGIFERVGGARPLRSDFRLVAATNRDLEGEVQAGRFRSDLYYRLAGIRIHVPPLRERREEIPALAQHFLDQASRKRGVRFDPLDGAELARLVAAPWPGNVRELAQVMERAVLLSEPPRLCLRALELGTVEPLPDGGAHPAPGPVREWVTLEELKRRYVREVLMHVDGRVNGAGGAAKILGVQPSTLQYWIDRLGLRGDLARARSPRGGPSRRRSG